jgi:serine/threonine-protein kinase HipA
VLNALTGNADGHAKNLALIRRESRVTLAPFYDLVCTRQWASLSPRLAFSVGGQSDPGQIGVRQWRCAAKDWEVAPSYLLELVRATGAMLRKSLSELPAEAVKVGVAPASARTLRALVTKLVRRAEALLRVAR